MQHINGGFVVENIGGKIGSTKGTDLARTVSLEPKKLNLLHKNYLEFRQIPINRMKSSQEAVMHHI